MATLIPELTISEFKKLKVHELKRMKSCEVYSDGEYLFTFIHPQTEYIRAMSESLAQRGNAVSGKNPDEIKEVSLATV